MTILVFSPVEVSCGLVCQEDRGPAAQTPGSGHRLLTFARSRVLFSGCTLHTDFKGNSSLPDCLAQKNVHCSINAQPKLIEQHFRSFF